MSAWECPACYRITEADAFMALCAEGHDGVAMRRIDGRGGAFQSPQEPEPYVPLCDRAGVCQYDRYCLFFHQACRFDGADGPLAS